MGGSSNWVPIGAKSSGGSGSSSSWTPIGSQPTKPSGGGGGILGALGSAAHWAGGKIGLAAHDVEGIPGGTVHLANTLIVQPWKNAITTGHPYAHGAGKNIDKATNQLLKGTAESVAHPLRDPFQTALTIAPGIGAVGKVGEAGLAAADAARAGEGGLAAARAAGKSLVQHGGQPTRMLHVGDKPVTLLGSRNPAVRLAQRGYDRMLQKALNREAAGTGTSRMTARLGKHAQTRAAGALAEEQRLAQRMNAVPANILDRAAGKLSKIPGKTGTRLHQAALELTSIQTPAEEAAAYHYAQAAKGVNPRVNMDTGRLYTHVAERRLVHVDESRPPGEKVFINPAHEQLAKVDAVLAKAQKRGDTILAEHNVMTPEQLQARASAPGRIRAGAVYEKPTPGKLGIESPTLKIARAERDRFAAEHVRALQREERWIAKPRPTREMTDAEAQARLAELDKFHRELVDKAVPYSSPYGGELSRQEQLRRNFTAGKTGRRPTTVKEEEAQLADAKLRDAAAKYKDQPWAQALAAHLAERDQLHNLVAARQEAPIFGHEPPELPHVAAGTRGLPPRSNPYRNRIVMSGRGLQMAQERVDRLEAAAGRQVKPTGIVGGETARPGRGYIGEAFSEKKLAQSEHARSQGPVHGVAKPPIPRTPFTGRNLQQGLRPKDVTGGASRHLRQILRFENTDRLRRAALETSSPVRRTPRDVLLAIPDETQGKIPADLRQAFGQETRAVDHPLDLATHVEDAAKAEGLRAALQMRLNGMLDRVDTSRTDALGSPSPRGYRWVDENLIRNLQDEARPRGGAGLKLGKAVDDVNSAVTALTVYFKIGHTGTRVFTNAATNLMQGSLKPLDLAHSYQLWHALSEEDRARMLAASGQHGFAALPHEAKDVIGRVAGRGAQFWARHADAPFRFNSLAYELRKAGITTPDKVRAALDALQTSGKGLPAHEWSKISAAARRADREAISYDRLNSFEKRYMTRAVWFYPWIKGSTLFTVRTMLEHPVKGAVIGNLGAAGRAEQEKALGQVPSYEQGLIPLTGGASPLTTDFSTFSPFATAAQVAEAPGRPQDISGFFNPVLGAGSQLVYGLNQYGSPSKQPYVDALLALGAPTPEQQIAEAFAAQGQDQSQRMFQKTPGSTLLRFLVGPAMPRRVNKSALAKAAARERSGQR